MGYRKITVNGHEYEFTIGRRFTKIKDKGIFENRDYGSPLGWRADGKMTIGELTEFLISPRHVRNMILGKKEHPVYHCKKHNFTTIFLTCCPFDYEILGKTTYMFSCLECVENSAMEV